MQTLSHSRPNKKSIASVISQHQEQQVTATPLSIAFYLKNQELINQMGPFYQFPSEEESGNDKNCSPNISTTTSVNAVTMENIEQIFQKIFQDKNSK